MLLATACGRTGFDPAVTYVTAAFPMHSAWNQYVQGRDDVDCDVGTANCTHAGEVRRYDVTFERRCDNLTARDERGVFTWRCDDSSGHAVFYSALSGRLGELLDGTSFAPNAVIVNRAREIVAHSASTVWWPNQVLPLPADEPSGTESTTLDHAYAVYVASNGATRGYRVAADGIAVVVPDGITLILAPGGGSQCTSIQGPPLGTRCVVQVDRSDFAWVEGSFDGVDALGIAIAANDAAYTRVRNVRVQHGRYAILTDNCHAFAAMHVRAAEILRYGVIVSGGDHQQFVDTTWTSAGVDNGAAAFLLNNTATNVTIAGTVIDAANPYAIYVSRLAAEQLAVSGLTIAFATVVNGSDQGIILGAATGVTLAQTVVANRGGVAIRIGEAAPADATATDIALGSNASDTSVASGSTFTVMTPIVPATGFVGGTATTRAIGDLIDWIDPSPYRTWNADGSFPSTALRNGCTSGTCRLYDWRVTSGVAFASSAAAGRADAFVPGTECPELTATTDGQSQVFLTDAIEVLDDGVGDDDGLCEASDACIYAPHIGAYQGEGDLTRPCLYAGTDVPGVTLYAYSQALAQ